MRRPCTAGGSTSGKEPTTVDDRTAKIDVLVDSELDDDDDDATNVLPPALQIVTSPCLIDDAVVVVVEAIISMAFEATVTESHRAEARVRSDTLKVLLAGDDDDDDEGNTGVRSSL